jgi:hypothetical protein
MDTQGNTAIESPHTCATNLFGVVGNKKHRLSGDMTFVFKKLAESLGKIKTLKLEL